MQEMSERNRIRVRPVAAPRGILFDRNGLALVDNRPAFTLSLIPREMEDRNQVVARLAVLLKIPVRRAGWRRWRGCPRTRSARCGCGAGCRWRTSPRSRSASSSCRASSWRSSPSASIPPARSRPTCWATSGKSATSR